MTGPPFTTTAPAAPSPSSGVPAAEDRRRAVALLRTSGAHFVNHYGRMATEDIVPWRGTPPPVHWIHHR